MNKIYNTNIKETHINKIGGSYTELPYIFSDVSTMYSTNNFDKENEDYRLDLSNLKFEILSPEIRTIYVVGGLYGNPFSLAKILEIYEIENDSALLIFNGDSHWFDCESSEFARIETVLSQHIRTLGNIEVELDRSDLQGCGCAYPSYVDAGVSKRANQIFSRLKDIYLEYKSNFNIKSPLQSSNKSYDPPQAIITSQIEPYTAYELAGHKLFITHGDEKYLNGWSCGAKEITSARRIAELNEFLIGNDIVIMSTSHTCDPVFLNLEEKSLLLNNGSAGMPNLPYSKHGLMFRISLDPMTISKFKGVSSAYSDKISNLYVDAVEINYDKQAFIKWFDNIWSPESPASQSYKSRIVGA